MAGLIEIFEKHNKFSWFIVIVIAGIIFYISSLSFAPSAGAVWNINSILYHFVAFFFLGFFLLVSLIKGDKRKFIIIGIIIAIVYAVSDEFHQLFVPGRNCSFSDFLLDSCGILLASFIYVLSLKFRKS